MLTKLSEGKMMAVVHAMKKAIGSRTGVRGPALIQRTGRKAGIPEGDK